MNFIIHHAFSQPIRPARCQVCHNADAVRMMNVTIRFMGSTTVSFEIPCCTKCDGTLLESIEAEIKKQDKEREP